MEDFRVGSTSYLDSYRTGEHEEQKRKKRQHHEDAAPQDDKYVASSEGENAGSQDSDFYSPSLPAADPE